MFKTTKPLWLSQNSFDETSKTEKFIKEHLAPTEVDLKDIFHQLNQQYFFNNRISAIITFANINPWGLCYCEDRIIKISNIFQHVRLNRIPPRYFLEYVVYHEMLHFIFPAIYAKNKTELFHYKAFKDREKLFKDYKKAEVWEKSEGRIFQTREFLEFGTNTYQEKLKKWGLKKQIRQKYFTFNGRKCEILGVSPLSTKYKFLAKSKIASWTPEEYQFFTIEDIK